jgi:hypothetical protein
MDFFPGEPGTPWKKARYSMVRKLARETALDRKQLFRALSSIGQVGELNLGAKLAYTADASVKEERDVVLDNLTFEEATLVDRALEENGLSLMVLPAEYLINPSGRTGVLQTSANADGPALHLVPDMGAARALERADIVYMASYTMATFVEKKLELPGMRGKWDVEIGAHASRQYSYSVGMLRDSFLDIYTADSRVYRISPLALSGSEGREERNAGEQFRGFVESAAEVAGPACLDESVFLFLTGCRDRASDEYDVKGFVKRILEKARFAGVYVKAIGKGIRNTKKSR